MSIEIKRSDKYVDYYISAPNNRGYITIDTSDWIDKPWMFYELPSLKFEIYTETNDELIKYQNFSREIRTYNPVYSPLGILNVTIDIRNVPTSFILRITPIFDNDSISARNMLIENGIENGELWGTDQGVPTQLFNINIEFIDYGSYVPPVPPPVPPTHEETTKGVPPLTLTNCIDGDSVEWSISGNMYQSSTPTRDIPIEIKGVGDNTMSANDAFKVINGYLKNGTSIVADIDNRTLVYKLEPNTKYHISLEKKNSNADDIVYSFSSREPNIGDSITVGHIYPAVYDSVSYSFDITTDSTNTWLCLKLCKVSITDFDLAWNSVKIVGGSYIVPIISNGSTASTVYLNKPLYGIGSDYGEVVLTGSERIDTSGSSSGELNTYYYSYRYSDLNMDDIIDNGEIMTDIPYPTYESDYFTNKEESRYDSYTNIRDGEVGANSVNSSSPNDYIIFGSKLSSQSAFKSWLSEQYTSGMPVKIKYKSKNTRDSIDYNADVSKIKRHWASKVLDGNTPIVRVERASGTGSLYCAVCRFDQIGISDIAYSGDALTDKTYPNIYCTHYAMKTTNRDKYNYIMPDEIGANALDGRSTNDFLIIGTDKSSVSDFQNWLESQKTAGTPVTIYYILETPVEEDIALQPITLTSGTNVLNVDTSVKPIIASITYIKTD